MRTFKYDIGYDENKTPYIELPEDYVDNTEDKFMIASLSTFLLNTALENSGNKYDEMDAVILENTIMFLNGLTHEMAKIIKSKNEVSEEISEILENKKYHIIVDKIKDRNELPEFNIIYGDNIYERKEKELRVLVMSNKKIYNLVGGITNKHWVEYKGG